MEESVASATVTAMNSLTPEPSILCALTFIPLLFFNVSQAQTGKGAAAERINAEKKVQIILYLFINS